MLVYYKKNKSDIKVSYDTKQSPLLDLTLNDTKSELQIIGPKCKAKLNTGLNMYIPVGYIGLALFTHPKLYASTSTVFVNSLDTNEISFEVQNISSDYVTVQNGDVIGQLLIVPYEQPVLKEVSETEWSTISRGY